MKYIYFPVSKTIAKTNEIYCPKDKYKYKRLHTSLDALIRCLKLNQQQFPYYIKFPISLINIETSRFNVDTEVSAILPFRISFEPKDLKPLNYKLYIPHINPVNKNIDSDFTTNLIWR